MTETITVKKGKSGLGKGLSSLIGERNLKNAPSEKAPKKGETGGRHMLSLKALTPGNFQPRKYFSEESLHELADSIRQKGVMQPITVRPFKNNTYEIIAGERRWRASKIAGLSTIPAIVRDLNDKQALEYAIIENIQRQDLTPIEEAEAYERLINEFSYTHEEISSNLGKSRSHITNLQRLLTLPADVKEMVGSSLSMGHARALVTSENPSEVAATIVKKHLNVRQTEKLCRDLQKKKNQPVQPQQVAEQKEVQKDEDLMILEQQLSTSLGMQVNIEDGDTGGKVSILFHNLEQLNTILQRLGNQK